MHDTGSGAEGAVSSTTSTPASSGTPGRSTLTGTLQRKGSGAAAGGGGGGGGGGNGDGGGGGGSNQEIAAAGFSGPPMDLPYRSEMEAGFGVSFGGISVYGGGAAAQASRSLNAEAYAVGQQIAFKDTNPAKEVVAHELAHTIQQGDAGPVQTWSEGSAGDSFEQEADLAAATVVAGGKATVAQRTGATIHKWGGEDHYTIGNLAGQKAFQQLAAMGIDNPGVPAVRVVGPEGTGVQRPDDTTGNAAGAAANEPNRVASSGTGMTTSENQRTMGIRTNDGNVISMGAASRYSGDYATTVNGIGGLAGRSDELSGGGSGRRGQGQGANLIQFAQMTIGGTTNANHFYPVNGMEYRGHHAKAMSKAGRAWSLSQAGDQAAAQTALNEAMQEEGFANHFLQDTFSSGHMAPRSLDSVEHLTSDQDALAVAMNNTANNVDTTVGRAGTAVGRAAGNVTGLFSGVWNRVSNLQNPFSAEGRASIAQEMNRQANNTGTRWGNTAERASNAVTGTFQTGGIVHSVVRGAEQLRGFASDAYQGLVRSKQWHDFFCSIPNGLPTTLGRNFHGDHFMDGGDLDFVSNTAANSIVQVLSAAQGRPATPPVNIPAPDFAGIMADPMAGPAWRMMMSDYQASMRAARAQIDQNPNATGTTDGGTQFSSSEVMNLIQQNVFGGGDGALPTAEQTRAQSMAQAQIDPGGTLTTKFRYIKGSFDGIHHYLTTEFGFNKNLAGGQGLDDNLNRPVDSDRATGASTDTGPTDVVGDAATGPAFDPCQLEGRWRMVSTLQQQINDYTAALTACMSNSGFSTQHQAQLQTQLAMCTQMTATANTWKSQLDALFNAGTLNFEALAHLPVGVPGNDANQIAWGAGHPEWISNHIARRSYRETMVGECVNWRQRLAQAPVWGEASTSDTGGGEPAPPPTPGP